jgi:hypothetical protein
LRLSNLIIIHLNPGAFYLSVCILTLTMPLMIPQNCSGFTNVDNEDAHVEQETFISMNKGERI